MAPKPYRFQATIYRIWMMRHVDVPDDIALELQKQLAQNGRTGAQRKPTEQDDPIAARKQMKRDGRAGAPRQTQNGPAAMSKKINSREQANPRRQANPKYIPVAAIVNGKSARTTLVPAGGGRFRMQINTALRKAARADVGDLVGVELRLDLESREVPLPTDLKAGLKQHPKAWKAFEALPAGHRRQFIQWFDSAKSSEARARRLRRAIDHLLERALLGPHRGQKRPS